MRMERKPIFLACFLCVIGIICSGLIASVHQVTEPIIQKREQVEHEATILSFFNEMDHFLESSVDSEKYPAIQTVYEVFDPQNNSLGRIYELVTKGYGGDVSLLVAYDLKSQQLTHLSYIGTFSETPGFGSRVKENEFLNQVVNQPVEAMKIDTLSGATITSSAVKKAIEQANQHVLSES